MIDLHDANHAISFNRYVRVFLIVGLVALALSLLGAVFTPQQFFQSYLFGYVFWIGLAIGCLAVLMMQYVTGGAWGIILRRVLESATRTLPLLLLLFLPLLFGLRRGRAHAASRLSCRRSRRAARRSLRRAPRA